MKRFTPDDWKAEDGYLTMTYTLEGVHHSGHLRVRGTNTTNHSQHITYVAEAKVFNPGIGIDEDPATGTAAGRLTGHLHQLGASRKEKIIKYCKVLQ